FNLGLPVAPTAMPGVPFGIPGAVQVADVVPSIGLPLLMEFRTYPDDGALGLNLFDVGQVVLNGRPNVRAFSTGGVATGGVITLGSTAPILNNATRLDFYGEATTPATDGSVSFLANDNRWKESMSAINGSSFFQTRLTFVSNAQTGLSPTLSSLGFAFQQ